MKPLSSLLVGVCLGCQCALSLATTADETDDLTVAAVHKTLVYLLQQQHSDGSWGQDSNDRIKATAEVYHALKSLRTLPVVQNAAKNWLVNATVQDVEDNARQDYAMRKGVGFRPTYAQALFESGDQVKGTISLQLGKIRYLISTNKSLWGPFYDYKYSTVDTALALRTLVHDRSYIDGKTISAIDQAIAYLLDKRNQGEPTSDLGSGWGFSSDDYSTRYSSQVIPTAFTLLALTEADSDWVKAANGVMAAARWLISKQGLDGRFGSGFSGDQYNDAETVLATLALARVVARDDTDALINQAYQLGRDYLTEQLNEHGHISNSHLLTALALQSFPLDQINLADADGDRVPDAIEQDLGFRLNGSRFEGNQFLRGNGLFGDVSSGVQDQLLVLVGEYTRHRLAITDKTVEILSGQLPAGMQFADQARIISGAPRVAGTYLLNYQVVDSGNNRIIKKGSLQLQVLNPDGDPDGDGITTRYELSQRMNPLISTDATSDFDADGWNNREEFLNGTDPWQSNPKDTDGDGVPDSQEYALGLDPDRADSDGDGMTDGTELTQGRDPLINEPVLLLIQDLL
jgi:hypothetical protein